MEGHRFDALTRRVSTGQSRRAAVKVVLGWAAKGTALAAGVSATSMRGAGTAEAAKCASGLERCGKACYDPGFQQCCGKRHNALVCGDNQDCSTATRTCGSGAAAICCTTGLPFCCNCFGFTQCSSVPCAEPDCVPA